MQMRHEDDHYEVSSIEDFDFFSFLSFLSFFSFELLWLLLPFLEYIDSASVSASSSDAGGDVTLLPYGGMLLDVDVDADGPTASTLARSGCRRHAQTITSMTSTWMSHPCRCQHSTDSDNASSPPPCKP